MFQIPQVQFAVASDSTYTFSGILGLGYAYPYSINYPSVLNLMVAQKMISAPIFSLGLGGDRDGFSMTPKSLPKRAVLLNETRRDHLWRRQQVEVCRSPGASPHLAANL